MKSDIEQQLLPLDADVPADKPKNILCGFIIYVIFICTTYYIFCCCVFWVMTMDMEAQKNKPHFFMERHDFSRWPNMPARCNASVVDQRYLKTTGEARCLWSVSPFFNFSDDEMNYTDTTHDGMSTYRMQRSVLRYGRLSVN